MIMGTLYSNTVLYFLKLFHGSAEFTLPNLHLGKKTKQKTLRVIGQESDPAICSLDFNFSLEMSL